MDSIGKVREQVIGGVKKQINQDKKLQELFSDAVSEMRLLGETLAQVESRDASLESFEWEVLAEKDHKSGTYEYLLMVYLRMLTERQNSPVTMEEALKSSVVEIKQAQEKYTP